LLARVWSQGGTFQRQKKGGTFQRQKKVLWNTTTPKMARADQKKVNGGSLLDATLTIV